MKKALELDPLRERPELDFSKGVRGKYYHRMQEGTNIVLLAPRPHGSLPHLRSRQRRPPQVPGPDRREAGRKARLNSPPFITCHKVSRHTHPLPAYDHSIAHPGETPHHEETSPRHRRPAPPHRRPRRRLPDMPPMKEGLWKIRMTDNTPGQTPTDNTYSLCRNHAWDEQARQLTRKFLTGCTTASDVKSGNIRTIVQSCKVAAAPSPPKPSSPPTATPTTAPNRPAPSPRRSPASRRTR